MYNASKLSTSNASQEHFTATLYFTALITATATATSSLHCCRYPFAVTINGVLWIFGRVVWTSGYLSGTPINRYANPAGQWYLGRELEGSFSWLDEMILSQTAICSCDCVECRRIGLELHDWTHRMCRGTIISSIASSSSLSSSSAS